LKFAAVAEFVPAIMKKKLFFKNIAHKKVQHCNIFDAQLSIIGVIIMAHYFQLMPPPSLHLLSFHARSSHGQRARERAIFVVL
jgi:hypothetical protein